MVFLFVCTSDIHGVSLFSKVKLADIAMYAK